MRAATPGARPPRHSLFIETANPLWTRDRYECAETARLVAGGSGKLAHMKTRGAILVAIGICLTALPVAADPASLAPELEPLRPWLGKTWKSETAAQSDKPKIDFARWERALNGKAVRILHSINDGEYGGETIVRWDDEKKVIVYHYFTTAGFATTGTMTFGGGRVMTNEKVSGSAGRVTEVRGTSEFAPEGSFRLKTEYLKDGKWQPGREATYREDAAATVTFK